MVPDPLGPAPVAAHPVEFPITGVTLYKRGFGSFERIGLLSSGQCIRLNFHAWEMDDVLKSLVIEAGDSCEVSSVSYDTIDPLERRLADFPFSLRENQPLSQLLDQLKGANLEVTCNGEPLSGRIVSARISSGEDGRLETEKIALLLESGQLKLLDLAQVDALRFRDAEVQSLFAMYLETLAHSRSQQRRCLQIHLGGPGQQIRINYVVPMPAWKASYRLVLGDGSDATLYGWAIVDNTTGEDWNDVRLSLISGRLVSYVSRLYEPRHVGRPVLGSPEVTAALSSGEPQEASADPPETASRPDVDIHALMARDTGVFFEYKISSTVTVRRNESAMLPFLQQKLEIRDLLVYSDRNMVHPRKTVEILNSSGMTLDSGPLMVFRQQSFAGEALLDLMNAGDKRLVSYGIDVETRISSQSGVSEAFQSGMECRQGILKVRTTIRETTTYRICNIGQQAKTLFLEHPARPEYVLLEPRAQELTSSAHRFEVTLAAGDSKEVAVREERIDESLLDLLEMSGDALTAYVQDESASVSACAQLQKLAEKEEEIAGIRDQLVEAQAEIERLAGYQERIRQNMKSLSEVGGMTEYVREYARQLATQESYIATVRDQIAELGEKLKTRQAEYATMTHEVEF